MTNGRDSFADHAGSIPDQIYQDLDRYRRLINNSLLNKAARGTAFAQLGLLLDAKLSLLDIAQFCYARAVELLDAEDSQLATVYLARAALLADCGQRSEAAEDAARSIELFARLGKSEQATKARALLERIRPHHLGGSSA